MLRWLRSLTRGAPATFEVGKKHPVAPPGNVGETVAELFEEMVVATLWMDGSMPGTIDMIKRRVAMIGLWDPDGPNCGLSIGFAHAVPGDAPIIGFLLPRLPDARLVERIVFVAADHASKEVQAAEMFAVPADIAAALRTAMQRVPVMSRNESPRDAAAMFSAGKQWVFAADDPDAARDRSPYAKPPGRFFGGVEPGRLHTARHEQAVDQL